MKASHSNTHRIASILIQSAAVALFIAVIVVTAFHLPISHGWRWVLFAAGLTLTVIQCLRIRCLMLLIDRIFANHPGKQILLALFIFTVTFDFALCIFPNNDIRHAFIDFINPKSLLEESSERYQYELNSERQTPNLKDATLFIEPNQKRDSEYFRHGLLYLMGLLVFNGLLIATINRFMATRADRYKMGANTYRNLKNQYVIIGYGNACVPIIRNVCRRPNQDGTPSFLILSNQDPSTIRRNIRTKLQAMENHIVVYGGDMNSTIQLRRLNLESAKEVFILGEGQEPGRDSKNLECAKMVKDIRKENGQGPVLRINMQLDKPVSYSTIKRLTIPKNFYKDKDGNEVIYLRPFNFFENWSRLLWGTFRLPDYQPLDRGKMADDDKHVHLVIAGFNEMGTSLLLEALRVCHYPNYNETTQANKTHITVFDPKMNELLPRFQSQYPYLNQIVDVDVEYIDCRIESPEARTLLDQLARQDNTLLTVAICFFDADNSFSSALTLPDEVYYHVGNGKIVPNGNSEVLVRQELPSGLAELLEKENGKFANVKIFGTMDKGFDEHFIDDKMAIIVSAYYHFKYDLGSEKTFFELMETDREATMQEAMRNWISLNEDKRFANRYQTEIYRQYQSYRSVFEQNPDILYQTEHMRWSAERSIAGYRDLRELNLKSETYQIHKCIVPYHDLNDLEKGKDRDVLEIMDRVMALSERL